MKEYVMLITYSWDECYVAIRFETEDEAIKCLNEYLNEEITTIQTESEYEPVVRKHSDVLVELIYDEESYIDSNTDVAIYRVIEIAR